MSFIWVKGNRPWGNITDVPICLQKDKECCFQQSVLKLKRCSDFFVFEHHLPPAICDLQYAFDCDVPPSIENGTSTITTESDNNSLATYVCDAGFSISNGTAVTCQSNGLWGPILPTCTIKEASVSPVSVTTTPAPSSNSSKKLTIIIGASLGGLGLIVVVVIIAIISRRMQQDYDITVHRRGRNMMQ